MPLLSLRRRRRRRRRHSSSGTWTGRACATSPPPPASRRVGPAGPVDCGLLSLITNFQQWSRTTVLLIRSPTRCAHSLIPVLWAGNRVASSIADASLGGVLYEGKKGEGKQGGLDLISHRLRRRRLALSFRGLNRCVAMWGQTLRHKLYIQYLKKPIYKAESLCA